MSGCEAKKAGQADGNPGKVWAAHGALPKLVILSRQWHRGTEPGEAHRQCLADVEVLKGQGGADGHRASEGEGRCSGSSRVTYLEGRRVIGRK